MSLHERPFKDKRNKQIDARADHYALTFAKAGIQVFTLPGGVPLVQFFDY